MKTLRRLSDESGQTIILAAVCMTVLIAFLGLAIDVGNFRYAKRQLQADADAVALGAAREIRVCGVNKATTLSSCTYMIAAANGALAENEPGYTAASPSTACGGSLPATAELKLEVHSPCGASDPNLGKPGYIEAVVSKLQPTYFAKIIGVSNVTISARAEATRNLSPACVYALDPSGDNAIDLTIGLGIQANCAIVDESSSPQALTCTLGLLISVPKISVTGGVGRGLLDGLLCGSSTPAQAGVPPPTPADPLAYLPPPPGPDTCPTAGPTHGLFSTTYTGSPSAVNINLLSGGGLLGLGLLSNITFNPGVYCGGINIALNVASTIVFNPGIYILKPLGGAGGLSITVGGIASTITTGTGGIGGIMFYNEGPSPNALVGGFNIDVPSVLGTFNLTAPTSGEYAGVLFFQPKNNTAQDSFLANLVLDLLSSGSLSGAIYAPSAKVFYGVNAISTSNNILVAKDISILAGVIASFGSNSAAASLGSPLVGDDAVLVQ